MEHEEGSVVRGDQVFLLQELLSPSEAHGLWTNSARGNHLSGAQVTPV